MPKTIAVVQSNYIPWKGYFDLIAAVDEFILFDDMQYTRREWRNRNVIKTAEGPFWLTIPVEVKGRYFQAIKDTRVVHGRWAAKHWTTIRHSYSRAAAFEAYGSFLEKLYQEAASRDRLSDVNHLFISAICGTLGIDTKLTWSMDYEVLPGKTERLVSLCEQAGATHYLSGPLARAYMDLTLFERAGIEVTFFDYEGYREYQQLHPPFSHNVSIIDLLLNEGDRARSFMKTA